MTVSINGEYLCELVRAHYDGDKERFDTILGQITSSAARAGHHEVALRLQDLVRRVGIEPTSQA